MDKIYEVISTNVRDMGIGKDFLGKPRTIGFYLELDQATNLISYLAKNETINKEARKDGAIKIGYYVFEVPFEKYIENEDGVKLAFERFVDLEEGE